MKNFNILGIHLKIRLLVGEFTKTDIEEGLPKMGGLDSFQILRDLPQSTLWVSEASPLLMAQKWPWVSQIVEIFGNILA